MNKEGQGIQVFEAALGNVRYMRFKDGPSDERVYLKQKVIGPKSLSRLAGLVYQRRWPVYPFFLGQVGWGCEIVEP